MMLVPWSCFGGAVWHVARTEGAQAWSSPSPRLVSGVRAVRAVPDKGVHAHLSTDGGCQGCGSAGPQHQACLRSLSRHARPLGCGVETLAQENGPGACSCFQVQGRESALCVGAWEGTRSAPGTSGRLVFSWLRFAPHSAGERWCG